MDIKFTRKQIEILNVIKDVNKEGIKCTVYDILDNLSYEPKRDSLLHSISILIEAGYIERKDYIPTGKRGRGRRVFCVTTKALEII